MSTRRGSTVAVFMWFSALFAAPPMAESGPKPAVTSNRAFKDWAEIFNNDSMLTSALLDRLMHHAEPVVIEGKSYRMKDMVPNQKP